MSAAVSQGCPGEYNGPRALPLPCRSLCDISLRHPVPPRFLQAPQLHSLQYWQSSPIPRSTRVFSEFQQEIVGAGKWIALNGGISDTGRRGSLRKEQQRHASLPKSVLLCLCLGLILLITRLCTSGFTIRLKFKIFNLPSTAFT